ncbi:hypothetical protein B7463_g9729, partial [Scytalidium lignicola]
MKRAYDTLQGTSEPKPASKRSRGSMATTTIKLTDREAQLRDLLLDVARYIDESKEIKDQIELRFAGGWVRDKLLGIQSHDIDTAINVMTGYSFSMKMKEYLSNDENMKKHSIEANDIGNLHKIAANPEKSKHLETVTTKIFGIDVDFVNLRRETYSEDSRNPQMEFGTAEEDALRRDATINALFYNLHTDVVEDFTGGLKDMGAKHIRTPLDPHTTFMDDPLRVLRLIRFASRLGFRIDEDSEVSMSDRSVQHALEVKISRERVGVELEKMLKGPNPRQSLEIIDRLRLYSTIFTDPTNKELPQPAISSWSKVYNCLEELKSNETPGSIYKVLVRSDDAKYLSWILAALTPWAGLQPPAPTKSGGKLPPPYATTVAKEGIKADNKICNVVTGALRNYEQITSFKAAVKDDSPVIRERDTLGMTIRKWDSQGGHWRLQVLYALLVEILNANGTTGTVLNEWQAFLDHLDGMDIMDAPSIKPLIDGTQLTKALNAKPGTWMRPALDICMAWQLRNPDEQDPSGAIEEVKNNKELNCRLLGIIMRRLLMTTKRPHLGEPVYLTKSRTNQKFTDTYSQCSNYTTNMFSKSLEAAREKANSAGSAGKDVDLLPLNCLPESFTLKQLNSDIEKSLSRKKDEVEWLLVLGSSLEHPERLVREQSDDQHIEALSTNISKQMLPTGDIVILDEAPEDDKTSDRNAAIKLARYRATLCMRILKNLGSLREFPTTELNKKILLSAIAFTDPRDPWTTKVSNEIALQIIYEFKDTVLSSEFIVEFILKGFIRPLFIKSKPSTITASGRKAIPSSAPPKRFEAAHLDRPNKPWKYESPYSVTVFRWAIEYSSADIVQQSWNQYIPPLLTLLDEGNTKIRAGGLEILNTFLPKFSTKLLNQTGLGDVIEDTVMPTLLFLPDLTPIDESIRLQKLAYEALYTLADVRYPQEIENIPDGKLKLYFRIMRHGVLQAYTHSHEHPQIVEILLQQIQTLVDIIPILSSVLIDPFGTSRPSLLLAGIKALQTTILNCWPRMSETVHRIETIKAISLCWNTIIENERENPMGPDNEAKNQNMELEEVKKELKLSGRMLVKAIEGRFDIKTELQPLLRADSSLVDVFDVEIKDSKIE